MTETTNTGETTTIKPFPRSTPPPIPTPSDIVRRTIALNATVINPFPCSTLPPPPKPADIAAAGEYFRDAIKKLLQWYAGNALFFANGNKPAQLEAAANGAKKGIADWESANAGQLP